MEIPDRIQVLKCFESKLGHPGFQIRTACGHLCSSSVIIMVCYHHRSEYCYGNVCTVEKAIYIYHIQLYMQTSRPDINTDAYISADWRI